MPETTPEVVVSTVAVNPPESPAGATAESPAAALPSEELAQEQLDTAKVEEGKAAAYHEIDHAQLHEENNKTWLAINLLLLAV